MTNKKVSNRELKEALAKHQKWLKNEADGKRLVLQNENLGSVNLEGIDLKGANLEGAKLQHCNLSFAGIKGANLEGADLNGANLEGADLSGADLRGANLEDANLSHTDLRRVDLRGADLRGANLEGADLRDGNLRGAKLDGANFNGTKLDGSLTTMSTLEELIEHGMTVSFEKQWFQNEKKANDFAVEVGGKVYDEDFLGGYTVMYPKDENLNKVRVASQKCVSKSKSIVEEEEL